MTGVLATLRSESWPVVLAGIDAAANWLEGANPGDERAGELVAAVTALSTHAKWEIRRGVATIASQHPLAAFDSAIASLIADENARVRKAAEGAIVRRRDGSHTSLFGQQHQKRLDAVLDAVEGRYGTRARDGVRRAAEEIANTFARELYHEVVKLLSPLSLSAERLIDELQHDVPNRSELAEHATRIGQLVDRVRSVMSAMRQYAHVPALEFSEENVSEMVREAADVVLVRGGSTARLEIQVGGEEVLVEVDRSRFLQAITNVISNAVEAYQGLHDRKAVEVSSASSAGTVRISVRDYGCGMSPESVKDARELFVTGKPGGTGFGLPLAIKIIEEEHGGRVELDSQKGLGTEVRILLPARQSQRLH